MSNFQIDILTDLPDDIADLVSRGQEAYEASHGVACDYEKFSIVARNEGGEIIGVLTGYSAYAEIYVDDLWVDAAHRKLGQGRKLLETVDSHFRGKGYNNINLVTNQFQAVGFYESCGYEVEFVRTNKHHPELSKTFFIKYFGDEPQTRGIIDTAVR